MLIALSTTAFATDINLTWDANNAADNASAYNVYQDGVKVQSVQSPAVTASIKGISGDAHSFYVTAENATGESPASNIVNLMALPKAPSGLRVTVTVTVAVGL